LVSFFAMIQVVAVIGSLFFGKLADKYGSRPTIMITLGIWIVVVLAAYFSTDRFGFYIAVALAGTALGSSQAASRSMMARLTPREHQSAFFGFYECFCGKASAIVGPLVFDVISDLLHDQRPAILFLALFFVFGLIIMRGVREE